MAFEDFVNRVNDAWKESYFNPCAPRFADTWTQFDREILDLEIQILIIALSSLAALATLFPLGGLGGLATFRALTERFAVTAVSPKKNNESVNEANSDLKKQAERIDNFTSSDPESPLPKRVSTDPQEAHTDFQSRIEQLKVVFPEGVRGNPELAEQLGRFVTKFPKDDLGGLIHTLNRISPGKRESIFGFSLQLGVGFNSLVEFVRLVNAIQKQFDQVEEKEINGEQFSSLVARTASWAQGVKQAQPIADMIHFLAKVSEEKQELLVSCAQLIARRIREEDHLTVMESLHAANEAGCDIALLAKTVAPLLPDVKNVYLIPDIIKQIQVAQLRGEGEEIIKLVQPLIQQLKDSHVISRILKAVVDFPPEAERKEAEKKAGGIDQIRKEREELLKGITEYLSGLTDGLQIVRILERIAVLPPKERFSIVFCALPHSKDKIKPEDREHLIQILQDFGKNIRDIKEVTTEDIEKKLELMKLVPGLLVNLKTEQERKVFLELLKKIPLSERNDLLSLLQDPLSKMKSGKSMGQLIYAFFLIAPKCRGEALNYVLPQLDLASIKWEHIIKPLFSADNPNNNDLRVATISHLSAMLQSLPDQEMLTELATNIWEKRAIFRLTEEQELAQLALRIKLLCDTDDKANPFSSFGLYRKLIELSKKSTPEVPVPVFTVEGLKVSLNPKVFEENVKKASRVKFSDLPKGIGEGTIAGFFAKFEARLNGLSPGDKAKVEQYIQSQGDGTATWLHLWAKLNTSDISSWASTCGAPDEMVPMVVVQLFSILRYIRDVQEEDLLIECKDENGNITMKKRESPLTPQEEALFGIAQAIKNCVIGQREGIKNAYFSLPNKYRIQVEAPSAGENDFTAYVENYLNPVIQEHISELFAANNDLMKEMTGFDCGGAVRDVHEIRYAKNLIAKRVGLNDDVVFDIYDGGRNVLHQLSLEQALTIYWKHAMPDGFIKKVKACVTRDLKENRGRLQTTIDRYWAPSFRLGWDPTLDGDTSREDKALTDRAWDMDEDCINFEMTPYGALQLLLKTGYFIKVD